MTKKAHYSDDNRPFLSVIESALKAWVLEQFRDAIESAKSTVPIVPSVLTTEQSCDYLAVSRSTLNRLARDGQLKSVRVAGAVRFRRKDLDQYLESQLKE